ncbi:MAG: outer membrane lipoprotein-sorting protein [Bdellovibrionales bacterium]|nr:outer membrane lipoprotein-sorting protein [Bdellovibrionales bacterium]
MARTPVRLLPRLAWTALGLLGALPASALDGREIMQKHEEARKIVTFTAKALLVSKKGDGTTKEKTFLISRKLKADGVHFNLLTRFLAPAEVKGEAILFLENDKGENDILLYLPAYQKVRRVERAQQSSSFMGSDFSYSDITTPHVDDYVHALKGEEACPAAAHAETSPGKPATCYKVEAKPATDSIRERTGYGRILSWVRKDNFMLVQNENYDAGDVLLKTSVLSDIEKRPSGKWFTKTIAVTTKKDGASTTLKFTDVKTDLPLEDSLFTQSALAKGGK